MVWRAVIEQVRGKPLEIFSGLQIGVRFLVDCDMVMFVGEFDTVCLPLESIRHFRIYQQGATV